jgi:hypothetical protein
MVGLFSISGIKILSHNYFAILQKNGHTITTDVRTFTGQPVKGAGQNSGIIRRQDGRQAGLIPGKGGGQHGKIVKDRREYGTSNETLDNGQVEYPS